MKLVKDLPTKSRTFTIMLFVFALFLIAVPALANSQNWSFIMDQRYLRGIDRSMTKGAMTNRGDIWIYNKLVGAGGSFNVRINVRQNIPILPDPLLCSTVINPGTKINVKKRFSMNCGRVNAGNYYLEIWKAEVDGYQIKGSGTLTTR
jgi:hypothetical protein